MSSLGSDISTISRFKCTEVCYVDSYYGITAHSIRNHLVLDETKDLTMLNTISTHTWYSLSTHSRTCGMLCFSSFFHLSIGQPINAALYWSVQTRVHQCLLRTNKPNSPDLVSFSIPTAKMLISLSTHCSKKQGMYKIRYGNVYGSVEKSLWSSESKSRMRLYYRG